MSIVAISAPFPGVIRVLDEGEKMGLWDLVTMVTIGEARVSIPKADIYILGAWTPGYDQLLNMLPGKKGVLWTSSPGEMSLEPVETEYLARVCQDKRVDFIWFGSKEFAGAVDKGFYAPYPLVYEEGKPVEKEDIICLFTPGTAKKNLYTQLLGVHKLQKEYPWTLVTNCPRIDLPFDLNALHTGWVDRATLKSLVSSARVNLCMSFAETFSYQVAEAAMWGTPSIISPTVEWGPVQFMGNPCVSDEILHIASVMMADYSRAVDQFRARLREYTNNIEVLKKALDSLMIGS